MEKITKMKGIIYLMQKKCKIRNEKFFEEYEKKKKETEKAEEKEMKKEREILARSPDYVRRGTVRNLLHGKQQMRI